MSDPELDPKWASMEKTCPNCKQTKNVAKDFGVIEQNGTQYAASWCRQCREEKSKEYKEETH